VLFNRSVRFYAHSWFSSVTFDVDLLRRRLTTRQEFAVFCRVLGIVRGYWKWLLMPFALMLLWTTTELLWPWLWKLFYDEILPTRDWRGFWVIIGIFFFVRIHSQTVMHIRMVMSRYLAFRLPLWLRISYYRHLQSLPLSYIERKGVGEHMYRLSDDLGQLEGLVTWTIPIALEQVYRFALSLLFLYIVDVKLVLIAIGWDVFYFVTAQWLGTLNRRLNFMGREAAALSKARLQQGLAGMQTVKALGRERFEVAGYVHRLVMQLRVSFLQNLLSTVTYLVFRGWGFFPYFRDFLVMNYLYLQVINGETTYGIVFPVLSYMGMFQSPIQTLLDQWQDIRYRLVYAERVQQIWDVKPAVIDPARPRPVEGLRGDVQVRDVSFRYENGFKALHGVSLSAPAGGFVGIVGPSGSGKSSLLNLIIRLHDPHGGVISVDGIDIREFDSRQYRMSMGTVLQDTFLSKESLRWNLMLGRWDATDEEMVDAIERCRLRRWFDSLPHGLDSILNEGTRVSVGEKQRLGVARALLRKADMLVLDEPTSSLDLDTEKEVFEVINEVRRGKTTLLVTHRLNLVVDADAIVVMDRGRVIETGAHAELLRAGGLYRELIDLFHAGAAS